jgi:hypothetical protein
MKPLVPLLLVLLVGLATPGQARDAQPGPWEMLGDVLRKGKQAPMDQARPRAPISKVESADLWDAFLTQVIKRSAGKSSEGDRRNEFLFVLLSGRHDGVSLLASDAAIPDPLRELFLLSWERLAPLLRGLSSELDAQAAKQFQALLKAGDALQAAQGFGDVLGVRVTPDVLRQLARLVMPELAEDPLAYDLAVDPELRSLFGFGAPLPPAERSGLLRASRLPRSIDPLLWLIPVALAAPLPVAVSLDPETAALAKRLNNWLPTRSDLSTYLPEMRSLLQRTADATLSQRESAGHALDPPFHTLYRHLVLATAWQESCWRQFVRRQGKVQPIQSGVGAVGLMQVYPRVWRGFYDVTGLQTDVGYNGRAGAEILHHYLRDYAIARSEPSVSRDPDDLARGTYAVYNGGPGHLTRYRKPKQRADLRAIDASFFEKYEAVKAGNELEVGKCFTAADGRR